MEVRELEERYISFSRWLWRRLEGWYIRNSEGITTCLKFTPVILLIIGIVGAESEDRNLVVGVDWQATLIVGGVVIGLVEVAYFGIRWVYRWALSLWTDYQEEVWE